MICYFSGSGNSQLVAAEMARLTQDSLNAVVDLPSKLRADTLGLVFPVHAWGMPKIMEAYLTRLELDTLPSYVYIVCTCGDDVGLTDRLAEKLLRKKGLQLDAVWSIQMPNTYVGLPGFDVDTQEVAAAKMEKVPQRLDAIARKVVSRTSGIRDVVPGGLPWFKSHVLRPLFHKCLTGDHQFRVSGKCNGCGHCSKICPLHNIILKEGHPHWSGNCTDCLGCYHHCPQHAILYGPWSKGKGQKQKLSQEIDPAIGT